MRVATIVLIVLAMACTRLEAQKPRKVEAPASQELPAKLSELDRQALYIATLELQQVVTACQAKPEFVQAMQTRDKLAVDMSTRYQFRLGTTSEPGDSVDLKTGTITRRDKQVKATP